MICTRFHKLGDFRSGLFRSECLAPSLTGLLDEATHSGLIDEDFASEAKWFSTLKDPFNHGPTLLATPEAKARVLHSAFTPAGLARYERHIKARIALLYVPIVSTPVHPLAVRTVYRDRWQIVFELPDNSVR